MGVCVCVCESMCAVCMCVCEATVQAQTFLNKKSTLIYLRPNLALM